ncbi:MAG TPA: ion channel, partial [Burkholderiales bacterium]
RVVFGPLASDVLLTATAVLMLPVIFDHRTHRLAAGLAAVTTVAAEWAHYVLPGELHNRWLAVIHSGALMVLMGYATVVILRNIFRQQVVRSDDVLGAVCGYLLAAGAWANLHALTEIFDPGSYSMGGGFDWDLSTWQGSIASFYYVSLGTLSSVGSGDIAPVRAPATIFVVLETVFGQFYLAVVVAQLVGARMAQGPAKNRRGWLDAPEVAPPRLRGSRYLDQGPVGSAARA